MLKKQLLYLNRNSLLRSSLGNFFFQFYYKKIIVEKLTVK